MAFNRAKIAEVKKILEGILGNDLTQAILAMAEDPNTQAEYKIRLPESLMDLPLGTVSEYVVRASNCFGALADIAGKINGAQKILEAEYKIKFKQGLGGAGGNAQAREASAMESAAAELEALSIIEACVEIIEPLLLAARIASESARKVLDKKNDNYVAMNREQRGSSYQDRIEW